jgi:hypothetical protein
MADSNVASAKATAVPGAEASGSYPFIERRSGARFQVRCPVYLSFRDGDSEVEINAVCENVSTGGMLVKAVSAVAPQTLVTCHVSLQSKEFRPVHLVAEGELLRIYIDGSTYWLALCFKHPVTEMEAHDSFLLLKPQARTSGQR